MLLSGRQTLLEKAECLGSPLNNRKITHVISFNFILFPGLRNDDETDTDPSGVIHDTITSGDLNISITSFRHKLKIYILLTDCHTFLLMSVQRIW